MKNLFIPNTEDFHTIVSSPGIKVIDVKSIKEHLENNIKADRRNPDLNKNDIWYEWNGHMNNIHALDTMSEKEHQLKNYEYMGYSVIEKRPSTFGKLKCNIIILRKDPEYKSDFKMNTHGFIGFAAAVGIAKSEYDHIILEIPSK